MSTRGPRQPRHATTEELALWREAMRDAMPLQPAPSHPPPAAPMILDPAPAAIDPRSAAVADAGAPPPPRPRVRVATTADRAGGTPGPPPSLDRHMAERVRKGRAAIAARIDLHGMTQAQAHAALTSFLLHCWHAEQRMVLVITGKGSAAQGGGVLRQALPRWLAEPPLRTRIIGMEPAATIHGGDGAYYVQLRRRKPRHDGGD